MKDIIQTYRVSLARTLLICLGEILLFLFILFFSCVIFYIVFTTDGSFWGKIAIMSVALFFTFYVAFYPLVIYWSYYQHDKNVILTIDKKSNEVIYQDKNKIKKINIEDIVRVEQYFSDVRMLNMHYYKIIVKNQSPIIITCLLNTRLWKKFENVHLKRVLERYLWLLKKDDFISHGKGE